MNAPRHAILSALLHAGTLALASLRHAWMRSALLVLALGISLGLPVALATLLDQASSDMRARARIAPLVLGAKGSESDLVFGTMFFAATPPAGLAMRDLARVETERLATAVPMAVGATARKASVVGTAVDYFALRRLRPAEGRVFATIGECVAGAEVARELGLGVGGRVFTDPESLSSLAGVFPLELTVVGVLPRTNSPDDRALFVDLRTMWSIRGLGHRHDAPKQSATPGALIGQKDANQIAGEALPLARGAAEGVVGDFHFHGAVDEFPIDGALVVPTDAKAQAILLGRFTGSEESLQLVRPDLFAERVLERIFGVGRVLGAVAAGAAALVGLVTATTFALSIRLRAEELALMRRLGASRGRIAVFLAVEAGMMLAVAVALAAMVAATAPLFASSVLRFASGA